MRALSVLTAETPVGLFHLIVDEHGVAHASGFGDLADLVVRLPAMLRAQPFQIPSHHPYIEAINHYFQGELRALDGIPRSQVGSDFQTSVWRTMSGIPAGQTLSYKDLAQNAGFPGATRAAGTACCQNRLILLVPCHRIIKSDGGIGSYVYGSETKKYLLDHERRYGVA